MNDENERSVASAGSAWIPVAERLPEEWEDVLFVTDDGESLSGVLFFGWYREEVFMADNGSEIAEFLPGGLDGVHFWMPIQSRSELFKASENASLRYP